MKFRDPNNLINLIIARLDERGALGKDCILGTVEFAQYMTPTGWKDPTRKHAFWCDVQPEKQNSSLIEYVPLAHRVMNYDDDLGVIFVPKLGTEVLIGWVDGRPTILACQEWDIMIIKKGEDFYVYVDKKNNVQVKTSGTIDVKSLRSVIETAVLSWQIDAPRITLGPLGAEPAVLGLRLNAWLATHTHVLTAGLTPGGPMTSPPLQIPTLPVHLSQRVWLDM